jgi:hypothetical protein
MIVSAVGFVIWGADFVQQLDGFGVYKPTTMARSGFGMALFPLLSFVGFLFSLDRDRNLQFSHGRS